MLTDKTKNLVQFGYISLLVLWTVGEIAQVLWLYFAHDLTMFHYGNQIGLTDFIHFYLAGKITNSPFRHEAFSWEMQKQFFETITNSRIIGTDFYTPYFPLTFLLMVPFSCPPIEIAHLLFIFSSTIFALISIRWLLRTINFQKNSINFFVIAGILASNPCWRNWTQGQIMWLYLGLTCIYLASLLKKKDFSAGFALALCTIKPQYAIYLLVPALMLKRWRLILTFLTCEIIFALLCGQIFSWPELLKYPSLLNQYEQTASSVKLSSMYCLSAFSSLILPQAATFKLGALLNLISVVIASFASILFLTKNTTQQNNFWLISVLILIALLFSPHTHLHDTLLIAIPALLTLPILAQSKNLSPTLLIWQWTLYLFPVISWFCFFLILSGLPGNLILSAIIAILSICGIRQLITPTSLSPYLK